MKSHFVVYWYLGRGRLPKFKKFRDEGNALVFASDKSLEGYNTKVEELFYEGKEFVKSKIIHTIEKYRKRGINNLLIGR